MEDGNYEIYVVPHSHIDTCWYWDHPKAKVYSRKVLASALKLLKEDPNYTFCQDQVTVLKAFWQGLDDEERRFLKAFIREGRFEVVGGMYVQPEIAEPNGECLIRQILVGRRWMREVLGADSLCGWNIDTFGHCGQIPQIIAKSGMKYYVFARGVPPELQGQRSEFWFQSPDGSKVLTHWMSAHYGCQARDVKETLRRAVEHATGNKLLIPWGCDVYVPDEDSKRIKEIVRQAAEDVGITVKSVMLTTPGRFFRLVEQERLPTYSADFNLPLAFGDLRGTFSNRAELKKLNRLAESKLMTAEKLAALGSWFGEAYPKENLNGAWERLLFNHFHDIMGGSHTDDVYQQAMNRYASVVDTSDEVTEKALDAISRRIDTSGLVYPLLVFNPLSFSRTDVCRYIAVFRGHVEDFSVYDDRGNEVPYRVLDRRLREDKGIKTVLFEFLAEDLPPLGYAVYSILPKKPKEAFRPSEGTCIENEFYRVELDPESGYVRSIFDKVNGREVLDSPDFLGNELIAIKEEEPDLEGRLGLTDRVFRGKDYPGCTIGCERTPLAYVLKVEGKFEGCRRVQEIILYLGISRIDFRTTLADFKGKDLFLKVCFPLRLDWKKVGIKHEMPYCVSPRPEGYYCAQSFVDCCDGGYGVTLINRGTAGYWVEDGKLEIVLLRAVSDYRGYYAPLAAEEGTHVFEYSLYPHPGGGASSDVVKVAHGLNSPLLVMGTDEHPGEWGRRRSFVSVVPEEFEVTVVKKAEDGDGIVLRGWETTGKAAQVTIEFSRPVKEAWLVNLAEEIISPLQVQGNKAVFSCRGFEIISVMIR
ncbi:MAG TPA: alpha-mannosidase [Candidatus Latescibacteria bacterium]|nr:alpha-mannosidase [Candidatus Latescibacterota bacterium]